MRRALAIAGIGLAALVPTASAHAEDETPQGTFSSPSRAVAGAPIWIRSITPCPVVAGSYQFVRVGISPQSAPHDLTYIESTDGDLDRDGSWEVTISAPSDMANGITKSYDVQVQCLMDDAPYATPDRTPSSNTTLPPIHSTFRYFLRGLDVTGFAAASATPEGAATDATDASTTTSSSTTSTTTAIATTSTALSAAGIVTTTRPDDEKQRAAEARAELAARDDSSSGGIALDGNPASVSAPAPGADGGLPWWSFVAATMLAVGAVVAYGARRSPSLVGEVDGQLRGDSGVLLGEGEVGGDGPAVGR